MKIVSEGIEVDVKLNEEDLDFLRHTVEHAYDEDDKTTGWRSLAMRECLSRKLARAIKETRKMSNGECRVANDEDPATNGEAGSLDNDMPPF